MLEQPTVLGFPITPWLIIFFISFIAIFVGIIMLMYDIKHKNFITRDAVAVNNSDSTVPYSNSTTTILSGQPERINGTTGTMPGKTERIYGTTKTMHTNGTTSLNSHDKTSRIYDSDTTTSALKETYKFSVTDSKKDDFSFTGTTDFYGPDTFSSATESINQTEYPEKIMYCSKCGNKFDGGKYCSKCGNKI